MRLEAAYLGSFDTRLGGCSGRSGNILLSTGDANASASPLGKGHPIGAAIEVESREGEKFTCCLSCRGDRWYAAAVSWDKLLGPMLRFSRWQRCGTVFHLNDTDFHSQGSVCSSMISRSR